MSNIPFEQYLTDEDLNYEICLLKDPQNVENWIKYAQHKQLQSPTDLLPVISILFRSLKTNPSNQTLWETYISKRLHFIQENITSNEIESILNLYSQALKSITPSPTISFYTEYLKFLDQYNSYLDPNLVESQFNVILKTLKPSIHGAIWIHYLSYASNADSKRRFTLWSRYWVWIWKCFELNLDLQRLNEGDGDLPELNQAFKELCKCCSDMDQLTKVNQYFNSMIKSKETIMKLGVPEYELYVEVFDAHISVLAHIDEELRDNLMKTIGEQFTNLETRFPDQRTSFSIKYAKILFQYESPLAAFKFYDNQLSKCLTMRDFSFIFDSYTSLYEKYITELSEGGDSTKLHKEMDQYEQLLNSRDLLVNDLHIRKHPNSVSHWLTRIKIFENDINKMLETYSKAILSIDIARVPHSEMMLLPKLWCHYALTYFKHNDFETAYNLLETACNMSWEDIKQKEYVIIGYTNMMLDSNEQEGLALGLNLLKRFLENHDTNYDKGFDIRKSTKLWAYYIDLCESSDNDNETIRLYEKVMQLKIVSAIMVLNYCEFLEERKWIERCFNVFERGVDLFSGDAKWILIGVYLEKVIQYSQSLNWNNQQIRDIFETCIESEFIEERQNGFYLLYANWEIQNGSKMKAMKILRNMIKSSSQSIKLEGFKYLIAIQEGLKSAEEIYLEAIEALSVNTNGFIDDVIAGLVNIEIGLKSMYKARQVLRYAAESVMDFGSTVQLRKAIWDLWKQFELENGDESTYREMLRTKRYLEGNSKPESQLHDVSNIKDQVGFVVSSTGPKTTTFTAGGDVQPIQKQEPLLNEDAIDLEMSDFE